MTWGVTEVGINRPTAAELRSELEDDLKSGFGDDLAVGPQYEGSSVASILSAIITNFMMAHGYENLSDLVSNLTPESASNYMLRNVKSITGTYPREALYSTVTLRLGNATGTDADVPAGAVAQKSADRTNFITLADVTIPAGGTVDVSARSELKGPYAALAGSIDTIVTTTSGWDSVTNPSDAVTGRNSEKDSELRPRVAKRGSTRPRVVQAVQEVAGVEYASAIIVSLGDSPVDGVNPGEMKVFAMGGDDALIAAAIYQTKSAWAKTVGEVPIYVDDSTTNQGELIRFSRITPVDVYLIVEIVKNSDWDGTAGTQTDDNGNSATEVKTALVAYGKATLTNGGKLYNWRLDGELREIVGIEKVTVIYQGLSATPTSTDDLSAADTERLVISAENIIVKTEPMA